MDRLLLIARAIGCPARLHILRVLGEGGCSLIDAAEQVGLVPSTVHHHLAVLVEAGLAVRQRRGRRTVYKWGSMRCGLSVQHVPPSSAATV